MKAARVFIGLVITLSLLSTAIYASAENTGVPAQIDSEGGAALNSASGFNDVEQGAWYYDAVAYVAHHGLFAGDGQANGVVNANSGGTLHNDVTGVVKDDGWSLSYAPNPGAAIVVDAAATVDGIAFYEADGITPADAPYGTYKWVAGLWVHYVF